MAPAKRKRLAKSAKLAKSSVLVVESDIDVQDPAIQNDGEVSEDNDEKTLLDNGLLSKKQKKDYASENHSEASLVLSSAGDDIQPDHAINSESELSDHIDEPIEKPAAKVKKPILFKLRSDSPLAKGSQTARSSKGRPGKKSDMPNVEKDSDEVTVEEDFVLPSPGLSVKHQSDKQPDNEIAFFVDSDLDNESMNDSDEKHSTHSLNMRSSTKAVTDEAKDSVSLYLDSFPDITDSGIMRYKEILNNPLTLKDEEIDPLLREDHKSLITLRNSMVIPFVRYGRQQPPPESNVALGYTNVRANMSGGPAGKRQLDAAVKFTHCLPFVNPSRATLHHLIEDSGKICFNAGNIKHGRNAVFLTTGLIVDSQLINAADSMINPGSKVRQVVLLPFLGEVQRVLAFIGSVFEVDEYICLLDGGSLFFTTRKEGAGGDYNNQGNYATTSASNSPVRSRIPAGLLTSPVKLGTSSNPNRGKSSHFPPSLGFKDHVPVYDARGKPKFLFDQESMNNISKLPTYQNEKTDLPSFKYVATVGYTVSSWKTKASPDDDRMTICASLNLQFVIILGKVDLKDLS